MCIHRPAYAGQLYAYSYFEPTYACRHTLKNPNPKNKNMKTKKNLKIKDLATYHVLETENNVNLN